MTNVLLAMTFAVIVVGLVLYTRKFKSSSSK